MTLKHLNSLKYFGAGNLETGKLLVTDQAVIGRLPGTSRWGFPGQQLWLGREIPGVRQRDTLQASGRALS